MSERQFFIRVRGKIMGPFGLAQLRSMRDRGQFRAFHEISEDRRSWQPASLLQDLFPPTAPDGMAPTAITAAPTAADPYAGGYPQDAAPTSIDVIPVSALPRRRTSGLIAGVVLASVVVAVAGGALLAYRYVRDRATAGDPYPGPSEIIKNTSDEKKIAAAVGMVVTGANVIGPDGSQGDFVMGTGSGFCVSPDGFLITNRHVVEEVWKLKNAELLRKKMREEKLVDVRPIVWVFFGREKFVAELLFVSDDHDLSILKLDRRNPFYFRLAGGDEWPRGKKLIACGFPGAAQAPLSDEEMFTQMARTKADQKRVDAYFKPRDFEYVMTDGAVSRVITEESSARRWIQHTAVINPGNSGGPLLTEDGIVVGINTLGVKSTVAQGIFYSLSTPQLRQSIQKRVPSAVWE